VMELNDAGLFVGAGKFGSILLEGDDTARSRHFWTIHSMLAHEPQPVNFTAAIARMSMK
jgi:hypothetical protein